MTTLVAAALGAGLVVSAIGWLTTWPKLFAALGRNVGDKSYDFSKSQASNITVFGAIVGTVLSSKILTSITPVIATQSEYTALSLLFGILVVVGPLIVAALKDESPGGGVTAWAFLLATAVTLWSVIGQIATIGLVFYEAEHGKTLNLGAVIPVWCVLGLALGLVVLYGFGTVRAAVRVPVAGAGPAANHLI